MLSRIFNKKKPAALKEWYEVDLRSRKTGDTVEVIYSGPSYEKAWDKRNEWFRDNLPSWNDDKDVLELIDGTEGVFAYVENMGSKGERLGTGKVKR